VLLGVPRESAPGERRVALVPESVKKLSALGFKVMVEQGAGLDAHFPDSDYAQAGATVETSRQTVIQAADILLGVGAPAHDGPQGDELKLLRPGSILVGSLFPLRNLDLVEALAARRITALSTDAIPRTTRAQAMDTLSSMASIAGYKGALLAAMELSKYAPMLTTAAGTIFPSRFFIIGAGVAGLQAIATARRLGATVSATDVRPEVKEQIESVGARYVGIELKQSAAAGGGYARELSEADKTRQRELLAEACAASDAVIATALIGGVFAPRPHLIPAEMARAMRPGSVIVDLAAEGGGNCQLSRPGQTVVENGVKILAPLNLPATMPTHASILWSRNLTNLLTAFWRDNAFQLDLNDEILRGALVTHEGQVLHQKAREALQARHPAAAMPPTANGEAAPCPIP
jgi:NAD(P) transhydrogenase subunit alpha